jgi:hypothetical protein
VFRFVARGFWWLVWLVCLLALPGLTACGRPATQGECDEIVGRIAELELREAKTASPDEVQKQVLETKQAFREKTKRECVGKRITNRALTCVRNAKTAEEIVRECLN